MARSAQEHRGSGSPPVEADVVVDFAFEHGLLFIDLVNLGDLPAHRVRVRFDPAFKGLGGARRMSSLSLFRRLEFLAPRKRIRAFVDRGDAYFAREEPTRIEVAVSWLTDERRRRVRELRHDLEVYRDLAYVEREVPHDAGGP
jgi:hypothetical protein